MSSPPLVLPKPTAQLNLQVNPMDPKRSSPLRAVFKIDSISVAARITGLYLLSGLLWILFSDRLLLLVTQDVRQLSELQTYKGWFYVFITAGFLFLLVRHYFRIIEEGKEELKLSYDATLEGWVRALDMRDKATEGHTMRVTELAQALAQQIGLPEEEIEIVRVGAMLHDIGKMAIPDYILHKPSPLTPEEEALMRRHPVYSCEFLSRIRHLHKYMDIPCHHHEKWDGSGYPHGLKGEQIPLAARIFAVVDVYDALASDRPYRKKMSRDEILAYIQTESGKYFDPRIVTHFLEMMRS